MVYLSGKHSGHKGLSEFVASDDELLIFRSFRTLGARNLLYLQSTLQHLQKRLSELDEQDAKEMNMEVLLSTTCWETFCARSEEFQREAERMEVINRIKVATKEYYEALLLYQQAMSLSSPSHRVFRAFKGWSQWAEPFVGADAEMLEHEDDFIALNLSEDTDFLTRTLQHLVGRCTPGTRHAEKQEVKYYSTRHVSRLVTVITVLGASLVIEGAILCLYLLKNESLRLGLLAVFTSIFAASLAIMTDGRRADIILATAACAAILVVFVSQN